jgi:hypothetical protein
MTTSDEDRRDQQMVLREVLALVPEIRTIEEFTCYLTVASTDIEERGASIGPCGSWWRAGCSTFALATSCPRWRRSTSKP